MSIEEILEKTKSRTDVATVIAGGTVGFLLDAGLNFIGFLSPGLAGTVCASGALSVKIAIEEMLKPKNNNKKLLKKIKSIEKLVEKGNFDSKEKIISKLNKVKDLYTNGIIDVKECNRKINKIVKKHIK